MMLVLQCSRRQTRQKYELTDDPDDIGYRRSWASSNSSTFNYEYDNRATFTVNEASNGKQVLDNGGGDSNVASDPVSRVLLCRCW